MNKEIEEGLRKWEEVSKETWEEFSEETWKELSNNKGDDEDNE